MTESAAPAPRIYPVGAVVAGVRRLLEERVGSLWVVGEVSNLRRPASGHLYFTLKDGDGQLRAALFRSAARRIAFEPEDGLEVLVYGELTVYGERGELQIIVRELEPRGAGALQVAFEQLRRRLDAEGLFDAARKRALPRVPRRIGVATSASGAALRDVLEVARRRLPGLPLRLAACRVQGVGAEYSVVEAITALARHGDVDAILLVRGGGSLEDLQPFNTEALARAIAACEVPIIAGIGHEIDVTIADLVADARAPTPSAAAELAIPDARALASLLARHGERLARAVRIAHEGRRTAWRARDAALRAHAPAQRVAVGRARLAAMRRDLARAIESALERRRARIAHRAAALDSLSPLAVLGRGYGLVRRSRDGAIVREPRDAPPGEQLDVRVARAELAVRVESARETR
ncbi:MAG TPA: exodeoxyribonuclease VII large subunit [Myxococcota bacterium]|nr:exodeoxyribonuclease VII large subunit [Myxococcota bacterium]